MKPCKMCQRTDYHAFICPNGPKKPKIAPGQCRGNLENKYTCPNERTGKGIMCFECQSIATRRVWEKRHAES